MEYFGANKHTIYIYDHKCELLLVGTNWNTGPLPMQGRLPLDPEITGYQIPPWYEIWAASLSEYPQFSYGEGRFGGQQGCSCGNTGLNQNVRWGCQCGFAC